MSNVKLKDRIFAYEDASDIKLMVKLPLIIKINGRHFSKITSLLDKPYCSKLNECMYSTMARIISEVDGAIFGYCFNDEIVIVARNDQNLDTNPWYDNKVQKIVSATSALASLHFNNCALASDLNLLGETIFLSHAFVVPTLTEAINVMVSKQQQCMQSSIHFACFYELLNKKYNKEDIKEMLSGTTLDEKIQLLMQECNIDFNEYPSAFRRGAACYRVPKIIEGSLKHKWSINDQIPIFTKDQAFLSNIFRMGSDIYRG